MKLTPAMHQYMDIKNQHPDTLVLFRMGDFYETFYEDAITASKELDITLTSRGQGESKAPLAGIPYHSLDLYLAKLIKKGLKVTIVEQLEDPKQSKGLVKRGVVRIVSPGTVMEPHILDESSNNYIMSICKSGQRYGICLADISTGELITSEVGNYEKLLNEITKYQPSECITQLSLQNISEIETIGKLMIINSYDDRHFWVQQASSVIKDNFNVVNLKGLGLESDISIGAVGALLAYLEETQKKFISHFSKIRVISSDDYMVIDSTSQRNLELVRNIVDHTTKGTLLATLNLTLTPMGSRLLRTWILQPLINVNNIKNRQLLVRKFCEDILLRSELRSILTKIQDLERLIGRIAYGNATPRDLMGLSNSLDLIKEINKLNVNKIDNLNHVVELIEKSICDNPPVSIREGNIINNGFNTELDKLRSISSNSRKTIANLEENEKIKTGIKSLKVKFNKVFGYFIEVTKPNLHLVPNTYIRKQTQANCERYITQELKEQENLILNAQEKIHSLEYQLFNQIVSEISGNTKAVQKVAAQIAELDVIISLAEVAVNNNYVKPEIVNDEILILKEARHPVIEKLVNDFVPNDITLADTNKIHLITGPNMAGKSTVMRQVALITLMAQIGSFVPVTDAIIGITDRIFTRVGAHDDLTHGQSTFMVEMNETANILNNATSRSLVILDEIGRGTSTYDGLSIAWAVVEFIHNSINARTMFATHYHQLNLLTSKLNNIKNYNIAVKDTNNEIVFLYKLMEGGTNKSYGIQVAKLAGIPNEIIMRSKEIMNDLESNVKMENITYEKLEVKPSVKKDSDEINKTSKQISLLDLK